MILPNPEFGRILTVTWSLYASTVAGMSTRSCAEQLDLEADKVLEMLKKIRYYVWCI